MVLAVGLALAASCGGPDDPVGPPVAPGPTDPPTDPPAELDGAPQQSPDDEVTDDGLAEPSAGGEEPEADPGPPPAPEAAAPFELSDDEVLPNAKRLASDIVQQLTTYDPDDGAAEVAAGVVGDDERAIDELLRTASPLFHDDAWSRGEVVYPQLGGATDTDASVMVVVHQTVGLPDGSTTDHTRTVDVRLTLDDGAWTFAGIDDAGGEPVPRPDDLPPEAAAVLDDERIELPDSAVWDIHGGRTEVALLEVMSAIAERHRYGVVVLESGHPVFVFDTDRFSMHLHGLAVDIYHLDDELVVEQREPGSPVHELVEWLYDQPEVTNIGSPWALDGFGGRSFTDLVHQDHLHVEAGARPDGPPSGYEGLVIDDDPADG